MNQHLASVGAAWAGVRRIAGAALAAGCIASCGFDGPPDETTDTATDELVPCLATDESVAYPSSYTLTNPDDTPLTPNQDITLALQAAVDERSLSILPERPVIVIPPGTYRLSETIRIRASWSIAIVGASVAGAAPPTIRWVGAPNDDMFLVDWSWWTRFNRLTLDGASSARIGLHYMESRQPFLVDVSTDTIRSMFPVLDDTPMVAFDDASSDLVKGTIYYVQTTGMPNIYQLATTPDGPPIDLTDPGSISLNVTPGYNSYDHEITDVTLQNMKYGVVGGVYTMDSDGTYPGHPSCSSDGINGNGHLDCVPLAEPYLLDTGSDVGTVNIRRTTFSRISQQGVVVNTYNAIDWGIFDSTFERSAIGIALGVGQASVFNSRFQLNTTRDISIAGMPYGMIRDNVSVGSRQFLKTAYGTNTVSIVGNKVDNSTPPGAAAPAMDLNNRTITLLDNQIKRSVASPTPPAVLFRDAQGDKPLDIVHGGNNTQPALVLPSSPAPRAVLVASNTSSAMTITLPPKPAVAPFLNRPVTEVTASPIGQCCILGSCGECRAMLAAPADGSAIHVAAGNYMVNEPITIPANRNVLVYGDGLATKLWWDRDDSTYVAPGTPGMTATVLFDLPAGSRASLREMALLLKHEDKGIAGGISIRANDEAGNRVFVDETKVTEAKIGIDVNGFDKLATRLDMVAIGPAEVPLRSRGKGAGKVDGSGATQGIAAFSGEYNAFGDAFRVEGHGKLVSQGADLEGYTQGALFDGVGFLTVSSSRIYAGNAAFLGCLYQMATPYPQHGNYEMGPTFEGRVTLADMWTTGRVVSNASASLASRFLAINVTNNLIHLPVDGGPDTPKCGPLYPAPPESDYPMPPAPACPGPGGPSDAYAGVCPFTTLAASEVASGEQGTLNGRFLHETSVCSVPCANQINGSTTAFAATMLADLRAAKSSAVPSQCGPTDVRVKRVFMQGRAVKYTSEWRMLEYGIRVQP